MNWENNTESLNRELIFSSQTELAKFALEMAILADELNHHPDFKVTKATTLNISITTHSENRITEKDHQLADEIDKLLGKKAQ